MLGVRRHGPSSHENDDTRDQVALGLSISLSAEPDTDQTGCPPHNAHGCMLKVVVNPRVSPSVLGKGVDTAPGGNDNRIKEFLAPACSPQPHLSNQKQDQENDAVCDEGTTHDEVSQALSGMIGPAETQGCDASEKELNPCYDWQSLADHSVHLYYHFANLSVDAFLEMKL